MTLRLCLVDDTADLRLLLRVALESQPDFEVVGEAGDGVAAIELVQDEQPDLVLLDLAMPIMDGLEALPLIVAASPRTRIVVLSGFETASMAQAALAAGAHAYLQKGATPDEIIAVVLQTAAGSEGQTVTPVATAPVELDQFDIGQLQDAMATVAHELRSPATILVGLAHTLSRRRVSLDEATVTKMLDAIVRQSKVLDRVTADLLIASQGSRGSVSVEVAPMALRPVLEGAALAFAERTEVHVDCPDDLWVQADRIRVDQMLGNLLSNTVKYADPPVYLTAAKSDKLAEIQVIDSGQGVPEDFQDRLFDQYSRAVGMGASGSGLGLFVVKSLAAAQGGEAWFTPMASGGSGFCFSLPLTVAIS